MELAPSAVWKIAVNEQSFLYWKMTSNSLERGVNPYSIWVTDFTCTPSPGVPEQFAKRDGRLFWNSRRGVAD